MKSTQPIGQSVIQPSLLEQPWARRRHPCGERSRQAGRQAGRPARDRGGERAGLCLHSAAKKRNETKRNEKI